MPTWLLALLVVAALGMSGWLFWSDWTGDDSAGTDARDRGSESETDESADELSLPDEEDLTDERRRGEEGRARIETDAADGSGSDDADDDDADDAAPAELPATFAALRERRIAIAPASARGTGDVKRLVPVAGLRVPCATPASDDAIRLELSVATAAASLLEDASATVVGDAASGFGSATCVDARVASYADADAALVFRVDPATTTARVLAGRPAGGAADPATVALAAEVAAALDLASVTPATTPALRTLLANAAAIDAPEGASVVLVDLPGDVAEDEAARDGAVRDVVSGVAAWLARADVS